MYRVNTLKRDGIGTNAYKLQVFLNEKVVADGHGCYTALKGVKNKENQERLPTFYWLPKLHKTYIKLELLQILAVVRQ